MVNLKLAKGMVKFKLLFKFKLASSMVKLKLLFKFKLYDSANLNLT